MSGRKPKKESTWQIVETALMIVIVICMLATVAIVIYQRSTSTGPFLNEYKGKIVDKRISVIESNEGSRFAKEVIVEDAVRHQFTVSVTQEIYDRAKPGMLIQRTAAKGIELFPKPENNSGG
jgi:hypothetical protein